MNNIFKIYSRLTDEYVKQRVLLIAMVMQNVVLSLVVLIYANVIISNGQVSGELDYGQIRFFYNLAIVLLFILVCFFAPILFSSTLSRLFKNNIIEHLLALRITIGDIVFATYLRGLANLIILLVSSFPIISIAFYFGGFGIPKIIRLLITIMCFTLLISSICIFIACSILDANTSTLVSYLACILMAILHILFLDRVLSGNFYVFGYLLISIVLSLILISLARNTTIFNV